MAACLGLDIGSSSIKLVELDYDHDRYELRTFGMIPAPRGAIFSESEVDQKELGKAIRDLAAEASVSTRLVNTAFPESLIFTRVIELPAMTEEELRNAVHWEAERYLPVPVKDVKLSYMVLEEADKSKAIKPDQSRKSKVYLVAAPLALVKRYINMLQLASLNPRSFETEILAVKRALSENRPPGPITLYVSIGATTSDFCIVSDNIIRFTRSIGTGGDELTRALSKELGFDVVQAEEYKKSYGLLEDQLEGKIMKTIKPVFDVIVNELDRAITSFQSENPTQVVQRIVLTGGSAQLPGIVVYLAESLETEVQLANPWEAIQIPSNLKPRVEELANQVNYSVAVGLALKRF